MDKIGPNYNGSGRMCKSRYEDSGLVFAIRSRSLPGLRRWPITPSQLADLVIVRGAVVAFVRVRVSLFRGSRWNIGERLR